MRLPVVDRSRLELAHTEREEWRRRAESGLRPERRASQLGRRTPRRIRWPVRLVATLALATGAAVAIVTLPGRSHGAARPDYAGCIGQARYEDPIEGNQYQELVNALYACGIYRAASTDG